MKRLLYLTLLFSGLSYAGFRTDTADFGPSTSVVTVPQVYNAIQDPTGFLNRTSTLTFNDATRTLTIVGDHVIYINGVASTKSSGASKQIGNTTGTHWVYYDKNGVLQTGTSAPGFGYPLVSSIYYNTVISSGLPGDERHGIQMDAATHEWIHDTVGTRWGSGLTATFDANGSTVTAGTIHDEDIEHTIPSTTTFNVLYKNGSADFEWTASTQVYYLMNGANLRYNNGNNLADVASNSYMAMWIFATNNFRVPIVAVMGQRTDIVLADARSNNTYASLTFGTFPFSEAKLLYRVILRNTGNPPSYVEAQDYRSVSNVPTGTYVASAHNILTNLNWSNAGHTIDEDVALGSYGLTGSSATVTYVQASTGVFTSSITTVGINFSTAAAVRKIVWSDGTVQVSSPVTPSAGVTETSSPTWSGTHLFIGSTSVLGTTTNNNAQTGYIGEYVSSEVQDVASEGSNKYTTITTISLTPGDWDVTANTMFLRAGASFSNTELSSCITLYDSASSGCALSGIEFGDYNAVVPTSFSYFSFRTGPERFSIATSTTVRLEGYMTTYGSGTPTYRGQLRARRVR